MFRAVPILIIILLGTLGLGSAVFYSGHWPSLGSSSRSLSSSDSSHSGNTNKSGNNGSSHSGSDTSSSANSNPLVWSENLTVGTGLFRYNWANQILQLSDNSFVIVGTTEYLAMNDRGNLTANVWVVHLSPTGSILWQKAYGNVKDQQGLSIVTTTDRGYVVLAQADQPGCWGTCTWIFKIDETGNLLWQKLFTTALGYPLSGGDMLAAWDLKANAIQTTGDGGFILAGTAAKPYRCNGDTCSGGYLWLMKLNATGGVAWQKTYTGACLGNMLVATSDGYSMGGTCGSSDPHGQFVVLKTDLAGNVLWLKTYGSAQGGLQNGVFAWLNANSFGATLDGGYVVGGSFLNHAWIAKLDSQANISWQYALGDNVGGLGIGSRAYKVVQTSDGGFTVAAVRYPNGLGQSWLFKLNSQGEQVWQRTFTRTTGNGDQLTGLIVTSDKGYVTIGGDELEKGFRIMKLDSLGQCCKNITSTISEPISATDISQGSSNVSAVPLGFQLIVENTNMSSRSPDVTVIVQCAPAKSTP